MEQENMKKILEEQQKTNEYLQYIMKQNADIRQQQKEMKAAVKAFLNATMLLVQNDQIKMNNTQLDDEAIKLMNKATAETLEALVSARVAMIDHISEAIKEALKEVLTFE